MVDYVSEAEYLAFTEDWTNLYPEDQIDPVRAIRAEIEELRKLRLSSMLGRYVITCEGRHQRLFLQDRRISNEHFWTKYLSNAISFGSYESAKKVASKLKYNNPKVMLVTVYLKPVGSPGSSS